MREGRENGFGKVYSVSVQCQVKIIVYASQKRAGIVYHNYPEKPSSERGFNFEQRQPDL